MLFEIQDGLSIGIALAYGMKLRGINKISLLWGEKMKLEFIDIGAILAVIAMVLLTIFDVFDWKILLLFFIFKAEFKLKFK